jgi:two-component system, NarL family, response regulator DevR
VQVFIVDDSALVRQRLAELLLDVDNVKLVGEAATVAEALARIPAVCPDFVLLDIRMPDGDGIGLLGELKRLDRPPVVGMLTNYPLEPYRQRCLALGADFFWDKSHDLEALSTTVRELAHPARGASR